MLSVLDQNPVSAPDHLCCGNIGRAEILFTAGCRLGRLELKRGALANASKIVALSRTRGTYIPDSATPSSLNFFKGASGIGYTLLRMVYPELLPSLLLFE
ncbi:MAG: lanthionine synthetase LanC family protein [Deltaproteobacteria bacterium]|jgi:lantibiotic modifying enzyme